MNVILLDELAKNPTVFNRAYGESILFHKLRPGFEIVFTGFLKSYLGLKGCIYDG